MVAPEGFEPQTFWFVDFSFLSEDLKIPYFSGFIRFTYFIYSVYFAFFG